jgi:hypothetical protein
VRRRHQRGIVSPSNLMEVYAYPGDQSVKFIIDPSESPGIDQVEVRMTNSDGRPMDLSFKRWGTKLNVSFTIDERTPDGVAIVDVVLRGRVIGEVRERFDFWVIK